MLRYTGHPFVDVGVATICAFAGVDEPQDLSDTHLEAFAHYARDLYLNRVMLGYLSFVVFPNIINPATLENRVRGNKTDTELVNGPSTVLTSLDTNFY